MLYRIFNNKYVFEIDSFIKNIERYGIKNTVSMYLRNFDISYERIKRGFRDSKSVKMIELIEKKCGNNFRIETYFNIGYCVFGPVIYDFIEWLYDQSVNYDELWFLSREGWLLKKVFDIYCNSRGKAFVNTKYFLSSRRAASAAAIKEEKDIKEILSQYYRGSVDNLIKSRLGITINYDFYVEMPRDIEQVMSYVNINEVIDKAERERINYIKYCSSFSDNNIAVVDIGYSGTIQYYLSKLLNIKIDGLYLSSHFNNKPEKIGCKCKSLFPVYNTLDERENKIFKNQLYFEAILKAPYGQLISFDCNGFPLYNEYDELSNDILDIQEGICCFVKDMGVMCENFKRNTFAIELFDFCINSGVINKELFKLLSVEDKYCSDGDIKVYKNNDE